MKGCWKDGKVIELSNWKCCCCWIRKGLYTICMKAAWLLSEWSAPGADRMTGKEIYCVITVFLAQPLLLRNCWYVMAVVKWLLLGEKHWEPDISSWLPGSATDNIWLSLWFSVVPGLSPAEILTNAAITWSFGWVSRCVFSVTPSHM